MLGVRLAFKGVWDTFCVSKTMTCVLYLPGKEDYQELKDCLGQTFEEIEKLNRDGIEIDGQHFDFQCYVQFTSMTKKNLFSSAL